MKYMTKNDSLKHLSLLSIYNERSYDMVYLYSFLEIMKIYSRKDKRMSSF